MNAFFKTILFILSYLIPIHLQAQRCIVFVGSYNWDKANAGIYIYELDTTDGHLKKLSEVADVLNPAYLTMSPNGMHVYACTEAQIPGGGKVNSYVFNMEKSTLTFINEQRSGGENPVYLTVHKSGKWLVNANYTGGSVSVYPLGTSGEIESLCQTLTFTDSSVNKERQNHSHIHAAVFSKKENYIYLPDLGADKIRCFAFDTSNTEPLQPTNPAYQASIPGSAPRHITFDPKGKYCYCTEEISGCITAYSLTNGKPDSIQRIATHKRKMRHGYSNADIHISPDGLFLYASNRGKENNIAIFAVDQQNGKLQMVGLQSTYGNHPRNFSIDQTGKFFLVANQISGSIVVFKRNLKTGLLTKTGRPTRVPGASCIQIKQYSSCEHPL